MCRSQANKMMLSIFASSSRSFQLFSISAYVLLLLAITTSSVCHKDYTVPKPEIEVLRPKGLRVSIPDSPGIEVFAFHGNVNRHMDNLEAGQMSKDILKKTGNKWVFEDYHVVLKNSDFLSYWLFVIRNGRGYRYDNGLYFVNQNTIQNPDDSRVMFPTEDDDELATEEAANFKTAQDPTSVETKPACEENETTMCQKIILNMTYVLFNLQDEIKFIRNENEMLVDMLEKHLDHKKLTLKGRLPPPYAPASGNEEDISSVSFILREKLGINPSVVSAQRNPEGTAVTFELSTLREKIDVLKAAKELLRNSKFKIYAA